VALKLSEDRYQFRQGEAKKSQRATPKIGSAGPGGVGDANKQAGLDEKAWRDTALYNGLESPRLAIGVSLAVPGFSVSASVGANAGISVGGGVKADIAAPGFSFGDSASLGTAIPGAFSAAAVSSTAGLSLGAALSGPVVSGLSLGATSSGGPTGGARAAASVGFD
jgi:hypothetical protein